MYVSIKASRRSDTKDPSSCNSAAQNVNDYEPCFTGSGVSVNIYVKETRIAYIFLLESFLEYVHLVYWEKWICIFKMVC